MLQEYNMSHRPASEIYCMDKLIFQFFRGNLQDGYACCMESVRNYAVNKCDYIVSGDIKINGPQVHFEKLQLLDYFKYYDRILYLDADILITPNARNIFDWYPDTNYLYAFDENLAPGWMDRDPFVAELEPKLNWPLNNYGRYKYFNTGVMLLSRSSITMHQPFMHIYECRGARIGCFAEQTYFNYGIAKSGIRTASIDYGFNRMDLGNHDPHNSRFVADFIHYAGPCKYGNGNKQAAMQADHAQLYAGSLSYSR